MPSFLQVENISKSYGPKVLFDKVGFNINEGDKIALIAPNGTGKTSLLKILAGEDRSDSGGSIKFMRHISIAFLDQDPEFDPSHRISDVIYNGDPDHDLLARRTITELGLPDDRVMGELSGGERKRVAITRMLATGADFLIMDEPTNHLDLDAIEYLENALKKSRCTLFMVTHDRYFLDRVCNTVMEMDRGQLYIYKGDYANYLEKREDRIACYNAETEKVRNVLRRELEWIHATPCARSGKAKYRKQAFWDLKERAEDTYISRSVSMDELSRGSRLGTKVVNCKDLCFSYGDKPIIKDFTYNFQRFERVGIVGENGVGKSTFLRLLAEGTEPMVSRGESVKIGWYRQNGMEFREDDTVLDIVPDTHLLGKFLFPHDMFSTRVGRLSGGERRRLYLLTILMQDPNLLILDEPTNDLDIVTLNVLEEYLTEFKGSLIVVTHDRHFLDRIVDHLLVFCGDGRVKDFVGGYSEYRSFMKDLKAAEKAASASLGGASAAPVRKGQSRATGTSEASLSGGTGSGPETTGRAGSGPEKKRKLSYKETKELEALNVRLEELNSEKSELEAQLSGGLVDAAAIATASARYAALKDELDEAEMRWLELSDI